MKLIVWCLNNFNLYLIFFTFKSFNNLTSYKIFMSKLYVCFICILAFFSPLVLTAQNYSLVEYYSDFYIYNGLQKEEKIYFGSDKGVLELNDDLKLILVDETIKGSLKLDSNNKLMKSDLNTYNNTYNYLLPKGYLKSFGFNFEGYLYVISSGKLFIFKENLFTFSPYESVRSISENYIGTYGGIFKKNNEKLREPSYTNSYIREFPNASFICWNGLTMITDKEVKTWNILEKSGFDFGGNELGDAIDVIEIKHPKYIVSTSKGLYKINVISEENSLLKSVDNKEFSLNYFETFQNELKLLYYSDNNSIYQYSTEKDKHIKLYSDENIKDVFGLTSKDFLILTDKEVNRLNPNTNEKLMLVNELDDPHNIGVFYNYVYITSNFGLSLFNLNENVFLRNVVVDEFNKRAHYSNEQSLFVGSVTGLYQFRPDDLDSIYYEALKKQNILKEKERKLDFNILFASLFLAVLAAIIYFGRKIDNKLTSPAPSLDLETEIKLFIKNNITSVSVENICSNFNVPLNRLYKIMGPKKPGEYIKEVRMELVKELRKKGLSNYEISKQSGFSVSYLRQLKK